MAVELDAKHVVNFALQPVRGCPNGDARRDRSAVGDLRFHAHALVARKGIEDPHDIELLFALQIMHCGDIDAVVKLFFVAQQTQNVWDQRAVNGKIVLSQISLRVETRAVLALVFFNQGRGPRHRNGTGRLGGGGRGWGAPRGGGWAAPPPGAPGLAASADAGAARPSAAGFFSPSGGGGGTGGLASSAILGSVVILYKSHFVTKATRY